MKKGEKKRKTTELGNYLQIRLQLDKIFLWRKRH